MKKIIVLFGVTILAIVTFAKGNENEVISVEKQYSIAGKQIQDWQKEKGIDALSKICDSVQLLPQNANNKSLLKNKLALNFSVLNLLDKHYNPNYETPYVNIAPPIRNGIIYDSGISPDSIKEPQTKSEYEKALAKNKEKAKNANFQTQLERIRDRWIDYMIEYINQNFKDEKQINRLIEDNVNNGITQKELKAKLDEKKSLKTNDQRNFQ